MTIHRVGAARRNGHSRPWPVLRGLTRCRWWGGRRPEWCSAPRAADRRGGKRTRPRSRQLLATLVAGFVAAGCSSGASTTPEPSTSTSSIATSTTLDQGEQAILEAYRRYWQIYIAVGSEMKLPDPRLAEVATGEGLRTLGSGFLADKAGGHVLRGTIDLAPKVVELAPDKALVRDCYASHILVVDAATGRPLGPERPERVLVTVTLVPENGTWKVLGIRHEGDGCNPSG